MKTLLLFIFLLILPVSKELIYYNAAGEYKKEYSSYTGGPRRVVGYTADGDSINTDNQDWYNGYNRGNPNDMWNNQYRYYYDGEYWYRNKGGVWQKWSSGLGLDLGFWDWYDRSPKDTPTEYFKDKPSPIGSPLCLFLLAGYYTFKKKNSKCLE